MRVAFDDQIFRAQQRGGVSKYVVELIRRLPDHGVEPVVATTRTRNRHLIEAGLAEPMRPAMWRERAEWVSWRAWGRPYEAISRSAEADLMHHTFTHPAYLSRWTGPRVVTVHDMTPELMPEYFPLGNPHFAKKRFATRADAIVCVSQSTETDMLRFFGAELADRTHVIPLGVDDRFFHSGPASAPSLPDGYLLFVGVRSGYKRFDLAVHAASRVMRRDAALHFVVVGGGAFSPAEVRQLEQHGIAARTHHLAPADREMPEVYRRASVFIFPSEYEGFGLPTLEALASGTPTLLADASCSREVGGDAATYFPAGDVDSAEALIEAARTAESKDRARADGPARAKNFSWDRVASDSAALYRATVASRSGA